jgi:hypothetical protein
MQDWRYFLPWIVAIAIPVFVIVFVIRRGFPQMAPADRRLAIRLAAVFVAILVLSRVIPFFANPVGPPSPVSQLILSITSVTTGAISTVIIFAVSLVVIRGLWPQLLGRPRLRVKPLGHDAIDTYVREILSSNSFITALNESLPRGDNDAEFGLDSVPYLLNSIRHRRERLARSTRSFLGFTIAAAFIAAIIITLSAWVLVDDESVGAPRALKSLRESTDSLATSLRYLNADYRATTEFDHLARAVNANTDPANVTIKPKLQAVLRLAGPGESLADLVAALRPAAGELRYSDPRYAPGVDKAIDAIDMLNTERRATFDRIGQLQPRLAALVDRASAELGKDQNRVAEVVRRIALGLIVSTFFLAIVRFVANLYRAEYNQLLRTDFDDMLVRSFYVTFKASEGMGNQRAAVLSSYISALSTFVPSKVSVDEKGLSKEDSDLLKVILAAAAKKL